MKSRYILVLAISLGSYGSLVFADDLCGGNPADKARADAQMKQAEAHEKSGRPRDAFSAASGVDEDCVSNPKGLAALKKRAAQALATEEEKKAHFKEAFEWYERAGSSADAGRMMRKMVDAKPDDINAVNQAIEFFHRIGDASQEKEVRAHAAKNVEKALADEEKNFATATKDSLRELARAREWAPYAGAATQPIALRAEKHGDALLAEDGRRFLELALKYYDFAGRSDKQQKVRDKARSLGDKATAKGEGELAVAYYEIAGDNAKADALQKRNEAKAQRTEETRKKTFKKDQEDLEKELGLK